jgi:hypothetical protein
MKPVQAMAIDQALNGLVRVADLVDTSIKADVFGPTSHPAMPDFLALTRRRHAALRKKVPDVEPQIALAYRSIEECISMIDAEKEAEYLHADSHPELEALEDHLKTTSNFLEACLRGIELDRLTSDAKLRYIVGDRSWVTTTTRVQEDQLGCVPPAGYFRSGFAVGEPWDHTPDGQPIYLCFRQFYDGNDMTVLQSEARYATLREAIAECGAV